MVKRFLITITALLVACIASASSNTPDCDQSWSKDLYNACQPDTVGDDRHEEYGWGAYLDLVLYETKNTQWSVLTTYDYTTSETRSYIGGRIYLNRLTWQK